jgi:hypothetical protein
LGLDGGSVNFTARLVALVLPAAFRPRFVGSSVMATFRYRFSAIGA